LVVQKLTFTRNSSHYQSQCVCILFVSFNSSYWRASWQLWNPVSGSVRFWTELISGVTDSVLEQQWPDRTITNTY